MHFPDDLVRSFRVVLIGEASVGKTSIISQLIDHTFNPSISSTVGANFQQYRRRLGDESIDLQVWDTAGQERFRALSPIYYRGAHAAVAVFSMENPDSLETLPEQISLFLEVAPNSLVFVVGNKVDLVETQAISKTDAGAFATAHDWELFYTSAKSGEGIDELFDEICHQVSRLKTDNKNQFAPTLQKGKGCC
jgi:small GTP-binding protein